MWLFTQYGILMPSERPEGTVPEGDNRTIQVRTRRREHLDILRAETMGDELGPTIYMENTDYEYRAYCTPEAWARAAYNLSLKISGAKFKPGVKEIYGDENLYNVYNNVWWQVFKGLSDPERVEAYREEARKEEEKRKAAKASRVAGELVGEWKGGAVTPAKRPGRKRGGSVLPSEITPNFEAAQGEEPFGHISIDHSNCDHPRTSYSSKKCRDEAIRAWWAAHPEVGPKELAGE